MINKSVISMSGGLDSTMLAMTLLDAGKEVHAYAFDYGQRHNVELEKLKANIRFLAKVKNLPITLQVINLRDVFNESVSSLHGTDKDIPTGDYGEENMKSTVVENRNVIFATIIYGKALSWSKRAGDDIEITLGIHGGDHCLYKDTTPESRNAVAKACKVSNWGSERVSYNAPFVNIPKSEVLKRGLIAMKNLHFTANEIEEVLRNTHSCYNPDRYGRSCGKCGTCRERLESFKTLGWTDPIEYV